MEDLERAEERLTNIRTVEPILSALRTISMGTWQAALKQSQRIDRYETHLSRLLPALLPHLPPQEDPASPPPGRYLPRSAPAEERGRKARIIGLAIGSERGLVGRFNTVVAERINAYLSERESAEVRPELAVLGSRLRRLLQRRGDGMTWLGPLSVTALPTFERASELAQRWLTQYEARELDQVDLIYNQYRGVDRYQPTVIGLIPPPLSMGGGDGEEESWLPPIIETDPLSLYTHIVQQQIALNLYRVMLDSASAEHAARYQLMEAASQNVERLVEELTLVIQTARQQEITQEMQELAAGAGMLAQSGRETTPD